MRARRRVAELVAELFGDYGDVDAARREARTNLFFENAAQLQLGAREVAVRVALYRPEGGRVELFSQPLRDITIYRTRAVNDVRRSS